MRFVVVEISDNEEADNFVRAIEGGEVIVPHLVNGASETVEVAYRPLLNASVPQVYAVPTLFCECLPFDGKMGKSAKFGWSVHVGCSKPRANDIQHPRNLMEDYKHYRDRRYYMGFRANRKTAAELKK